MKEDGRYFLKSISKFMLKELYLIIFLVIFIPISGFFNNYYIHNGYYIVIFLFGAKFYKAYSDYVFILFEKDTEDKLDSFINECFLKKEERRKKK